MRGFPQPNPLVGDRPGRKKLGLWLSYVGLAVGVGGAAALVAAALVIFAPKGSWLDLPPPWPGSLVLAFLGSLVVAPLCVGVAQRVNSTCSTLVIPGRLVEAPGDVAGCLWGCLIWLVALPMSLPLAIALGAYNRQFTQAGVEYVWNYRRRVAPVRIRKHLLGLVQPGQVVWFVPRAWNRKPTLWSEQHGHGSPYCLVNGQVHAWFERAAAKAEETADRDVDRKDRVRNLHKLRKARARYTSRLRQG